MGSKFNIFDSFVLFFSFVFAVIVFTTFLIVAFNSNILIYLNKRQVLISVIRTFTYVEYMSHVLLF